MAGHLASSSSIKAVPRLVHQEVLAAYFKEEGTSLVAHIKGSLTGTGKIKQWNFSPPGMWSYCQLIVGFGY